MKDIVNSPQWAEVEAVMHKKIDSLASDFTFSKGQSMAEVGQEAVANHKARKILQDFLKDMGFFKGAEIKQAQRDFE